jgi:hypothetical protein
MSGESDSDVDCCSEDDDDFFPEEAAEPARACRTPSPTELEAQERFREEQAEEQAVRATLEAEAFEAAAAAAQQAAASAMARIRLERKTQCLVSRISTLRLQDFCRAHHADEMANHTSKYWLDLDGELRRCVNAGYVEYCYAAQLPGYSDMPFGEARTSARLEAEKWMAETLGRGFRATVELPEVFVVQCSVAFVALASRATPWPVEHRLRILNNVSLSPQSGKVQAEARELLLTLEKLRSTKGLPPGIVRLVLKALFEVEPPVIEVTIDGGSAGS